MLAREDAQEEYRLTTVMLPEAETPPSSAKTADTNGVPLDITFDIEIPEDGSQYQPVMLDFTKFMPEYQSANAVTEGSLSRRCVVRENDPAFEQWLKKQHNGGAWAGTKRKAITKLPVVVHIIYSNEYENISDEQVESQIKVLNADYGYRNADTTEITPFNKRKAAKTDVQFALAKQTPDGKPTTGINRIGVVGAPFTAKFVNSVIKPATIWDPNRYLNIWVMNLGQDALGFSQFPETTSSLKGLPEEVGAEKTDGVVINYLAFGTMGTATAPFNKGRTATHEIGHFLGLRHPWGDSRNGCDSTDFCADTPPIAEPHYGCGHNHATCDGSPAMTENFMDYTNDECMAMFTRDQADRMSVVLENSPRRAKLSNSFTWLPPPVSQPKYQDSPNYCAFAEPAKLPFALEFENPSEKRNYLVYNPHKDTTWHTINGHLAIGNYQNPRLNSTDWLLLPPMDFSDTTLSYTLEFDVAYSPYSKRYADTLAVVVALDCDSEFEALYYKGGDKLATASPRATVFKPYVTEWRTESINLNGYRGAGKVQIAFINLAGQGNNVYLDNVSVVGQP